MSSKATSSPVSAETRFWRTRALDLASSWWKRTSLGDTALTSFTGTFTSPKLMAPPQMDLGMLQFRVLRESLLLRRFLLLWRFFPDDLAGVLVLPQALERRLAQRAVPCPLAELDLADQLGVHERRVLEARRGRVERTVGPLQRRHLLAGSSSRRSVNPVPTWPA